MKRYTKTAGYHFEKKNNLTIEKVWESESVTSLSQMVAEAASKPAQEQEDHQASVQEIQNLKSSLSQAQNRSSELETQLDSIQKVLF